MIGQIISHYKIMEKLGEGGMGVVYKAHDTTLDRFVALKFLPNYLSSDTTEKERFYHEARAASTLNHTNVTTIHEIQEFDNQIYLVMEYVEGKTLKKLIEQETLSIKKVLEIAIQVCDGLAAAHEKGVVHRDIKSDNIMITPKGQVKITDFGLAKVKGASKLTKAGSTLGTAAYMSPEQAQGEEVDQRSDIFSFGVVLYELLTTKLPFRGEHQAALMYSLINEDPQPIARFNEHVSPEIERAVIKALAKDKEERYQHIDDLLADLRRERKNLEYAKAGYARTSSFTPAPAAATAPTPIKPKKTVLKYVIPAATIVVLGILLAVFNPFNLQVSTQKSSAGPEKSSLAVMYFENIPDPEDKDHTGEMLTNLLTTSLFQTKDVEVISRERLYDLQKELGDGETKSISPTTATKVAQRAGVSMMLLGSILQTEPSLAVTYRLIEVQSGKILSTQRLSGYPAEKIFSLVDTLALLVKNDLHVTPSSYERKSVASVTTRSPEAYRSYLEGIELNNRFYTSEATAAFQRAIELDSSFAMAYFHLAIVNLNKLSTEETNNAIRKAYALSANITERERLAIQATYASEVERDAPKAISILENLIQKFPHEQGPRNGLANLYGERAEFEKVKDIYTEGLKIDSLDKTLWNALAYTYSGLNQRREALHAIDRYLQLAPAEPNPYDSKGDIYSMFGERDSACIWWKKATAFRPDFPSVMKLFVDAVGRQDSANMEKYAPKAAIALGMDEKAFREMAAPYVLINQGQLAKARVEGQKQLASHKQNKKEDDETVETLELLMALDYELLDYPAMVQHAQEYSNLLRKDSVSNPNYGRMLIALAQTKNGNQQAASNILEAVHRSSAGKILARRAYDYGSGIISCENGNYAAALEQLNAAFRVILPNHTPLYHHALCLLKSGDVSDAINELNRLARWTIIQYEPYDLSILPFAFYGPIGSVKAHYWLGVAYEQQGQKEQAIKEYGTFLEIWKDADFKSEELSDAKLRLAKLKGTAAR